MSPLLAMFPRTVAFCVTCWSDDKQTTVAATLCWRAGAIKYKCNTAALGVEVHDAIKAAVHEFGGEDVAIEPLERFEFYDASRECFAQ